MSSCHCNYNFQTKFIRHVRRNSRMYHLASCLAAAAIGQKYFDLPWLTALAGGAAAYILTGGWKWVRLFYLTIGRDLQLGKVFIGVEMFIRNLSKKNMVVADVFSETAKKFPNKPAFVSVDTGASMTYQEAEEFSNKIANIFQEAGYKKGDVVALLMENCIEYIPIWIGLTRIGVTVSLLNFNVKGEGLKHCITVADCKAVIYSPTLEGSLKDIESSLGNMKYYMFADSAGELDRAQSLKKLMNSASSYAPSRHAPLSITDKMLFIYTSGTTGLPKAAVIRGTRFTFMSYAVAHAIGAKADDVLYNTLPLYHSNGGIGLAGQILYTGSTLVIRKKFSASRFFEDCYKHDATIVNYIGETCRYLLSTPPGEFDRKHKVRIATGNGLRPSIWDDFKDRFNIGMIAEFYGATEGNANMINNTGKSGAVGYNSVLFPFVYPIKIVRIDKETGALLRGPDGLAIPCGPGEVGELVGKVKTDAIHQFDGYVNQTATKKKIAYDVFKKGDSAFMTGDVLYQDELGYYFFQDRMGDTFRWKGENVSTNEVEGVISKALELSDVCVYGVDVYGVEGKAGMVIMSDPERKVKIEDVYGLISRSLPAYACPIFLRITTGDLEKTSTYKYKKVTLREQFYDPSLCGSDELFYFNGKEKTFLPITSDAFAQIKNREIRF